MKARRKRCKKCNKLCYVDDFGYFYDFIGYNDTMNMFQYKGHECSKSSEVRK